jgi:hypothetical protein
LLQAQLGSFEAVQYKSKTRWFMFVLQLALEVLVFQWQIIIAIILSPSSKAQN